MKQIAIAIVSLCTLGSCNIFRFANRGEITVTNFKTQIPFTVEKDMAIVVPVKVGASDTYRFHFDTHALGSAYGSNSSLVKSRNITYLGASSFKQKTTSSEAIDRAYYQADSIYVGDVLFINKTLSILPQSKPSVSDTAYPKMDGILGVSLMRDGVWKIDFEHSLITFASSMDSLSEVGDRLQFAKSDLFDIFNTEIAFNGLETKVEVDLGASASVMVPLKKMKKLNSFPHAELKKGTKKTAAGVSPIVSYRIPDESATINNQLYKVKVIGSEEQTISVIGLAFFRQFKYIIIDYPGKTMYVSGPIQHA